MVINYDILLCYCQWKENQFFKEPTFVLIRKIMPKREIKTCSLKWSDLLEVLLPEIKRKKVNMKDD
jgi:hypothetical protein